MNNAEADPFEVFAAQVKEASNIQSQGGQPLFGDNNAALNINGAQSIDEVADLYLKAQAQIKAATLVKKHAKTLLETQAHSRGNTDLSTSSFSITVTRDERYASRDDKIKQDLDDGTFPPLLDPHLSRKITFTQSVLEKLRLAGNADLIDYVKPAPDKITISIERK